MIINLKSNAVILTKFMVVAVLQCNCWCLVIIKIVGKEKLSLDQLGKKILAKGDLVDLLLCIFGHLEAHFNPMNDE
jgi:hypothetical protein